MASAAAAPDPALRSEAQALAATLAALAAASIIFDALSFRQSAFLLFLAIGCAGAHWSLVRDLPKVRDHRQVNRESVGRPVATAHHNGRYVPI